jgi:hypothetical protein
MLILIPRTFSYFPETGLVSWILAQQANYRESCNSPSQRILSVYIEVTLEDP